MDVLIQAKYEATVRANRLAALETHGRNLHNALQRPAIALLLASPELTDDQFIAFLKAPEPDRYRPDFLKSDLGIDSFKILGIDDPPLQKTGSAHLITDESQVKDQPLPSPTPMSVQNAGMVVPLRTGPNCDVCGQVTVLNGSSYKCLNCGNSMLWQAILTDD